MIQSHILNSTSARLVQRSQIVGQHLARSMASTAVDAPVKEEAGGARDVPEQFKSNAFKNQHIKYVPKKRISFDIATPDGPMALIFQAKDVSS